MASHSHVGGLLKQYRKAASLTQEALSRQAGYSVDYIKMLEGGRRTPPTATVQRLADVLGLDADQRAKLQAVARPTHGTAASEFPAALTPFIGRRREVIALAAQLRRKDVRLLTLTGPPGVGKTRLALEVVARVLPSFGDGGAFVELAAVADPGLILFSIADKIGVREIGGRPVMETLVEALRTRHFLLVLDNMEHLLSAAPEPTALLRACPSLTILVTSREILDLSGEHVSVVLPLSQADAVALFQTRAKCPGITPRDDARPAVLEICQRLDWLPLAIELIAARATRETPEELRVCLRECLPLLTGGPRDVPERHRTMWNAVDWSCRLLEPTEQILFAQLSVFAGGCTLEAAEGVCEIRDAPAGWVAEGLRSLVEKSLLQEADGRFRMLEIVREYALDRLVARGEGEQMCRRHAECYLSLVAPVPPFFRQEHACWYRRLEQEHDNLRAALRWALDQDVQLCLQLAGPLHWFWEGTGRLTEGQQWLEEATTRGADHRTPVLATALLGAGRIAGFRGQRDRRRCFLRKHVELCRELGDRYELAGALNMLGRVLVIEGEPEGMSLLNEALELYRELGDRGNSAMVLNNLGIAVLLQGDDAKAASCVEDSLQVYRELGDEWGIAHGLRNLGIVALHRGDHQHAMTLLLESLELFWRGTDWMAACRALNELAHVATAQGTAEGAARLWGALDVVQETSDYIIEPDERARRDRYMDGARTQLGTDWSAAWEKGRAMTLEQAVMYALDALD